MCTRLATTSMRSSAVSSASRRSSADTIWRNTARQQNFNVAVAPPWIPGPPMCRNIKTLANFEPPATDDEIRASALQFVRKLSGATKPSRANEAAFNLAIDEVTQAAEK